MVDKRTEEYLRQLRKTLETAEEICQCASCTAAREKKQILQCDKDRLLQYLPMYMFQEPSNFIPDLSSNPNYWRLGRKG
jgi:hypothetical protein